MIELFNIYWLWAAWPIVVTAWAACFYLGLKRADADYKSKYGSIGGI